MHQFVRPDDWIPADGFDLEDNALMAVKSDKNYLVVAGPGAGKTELLAQRACYLLQTNLCKNPNKILAISFKRDAAFNLAARVEKRVGRDLSRRFTSLTFDAFSKGLVDRFRNGIPEQYRPNKTYKIDTTPNSPYLLSLFEEFDPFISKGYFRTAKANVKAANIESLYEQAYPIHSSDSIKLAILDAMLKREGQETVIFPVLSRLAQYLLGTNPRIVSYLRQTYSHVFLDEFQDTTNLQYDLLRTAFGNSECTLTAVGDTKQRIMLWAGAMDYIFEEYLDDFDAYPPLNLLMNFRSAPRLVRLQNHLTATLMGSDIECIPRKDRNEDEGIAEFWIFDSEGQEAQLLAADIKHKIEVEQIDPREICLLYKQRPDHYGAVLQEALSNVNIKSRVENDIQDLLVEPIIKFCTNFIRSALDNSSIDGRKFILDEYCKFKKVFDDSGLLAVERETVKKLKSFKKAVEKVSDWDEIQRLIENEINEISFSIFSSYYPQYNEQSYFNDCISRFFELMQLEYEQNEDLLLAVEKFSGKDCVPIMTVHKSKGLEFSVVYFIGFEDQNFWNFKFQPKEDTCSFFVALSRAKDAVYFTFSSQRTNNFGDLERRSIEKINPLFEALKSSNLVYRKDFRMVDR
ncbi:MAG: ATP-dependent helicase [Lewinellaceae bacterium]|nr:ATP-dependent helicase [Lewinellaceae bacterium]